MEFKPLPLDGPLCGKCGCIVKFHPKTVSGVIAVDVECNGCKHLERDCVCPVEDIFREYLNQYGGNWRGYGIRMEVLRNLNEKKRYQMFLDCLDHHDRTRLNNFFGYGPIEYATADPEAVLQFLLYGTGV